MGHSTNLVGPYGIITTWSDFFRMLQAFDGKLETYVDWKILGHPSKQTSHDPGFWGLSKTEQRTVWDGSCRIHSPDAEDIADCNPGYCDGWNLEDYSKRFYQCGNCGDSSQLGLPVFQRKVWLAKHFEKIHEFGTVMTIPE